MHYMRQRRHGDPHAVHTAGRKAKPRPEGPELAALREKLAALRAAAGSDLWQTTRRLVAENNSLKRQLASLQAAQPGAEALGRKVAKLEKELAAEKARVAALGGKRRPQPRWQGSLRGCGRKFKICGRITSSRGRK